jgi:hypothetical protein
LRIGMLGQLPHLHLLRIQLGLLRLPLGKGGSSWQGSG